MCEQLSVELLIAAAATQALPLKIESNLLINTAWTSLNLGSSSGGDVESSSSPLDLQQVLQHEAFFVIKAFTGAATILAYESSKYSEMSTAWMPRRCCLVIDLRCNKRWFSCIASCTCKAALARVSARVSERFDRRRGSLSTDAATDLGGDNTFTSSSSDNISIISESSPSSSCAASASLSF